MFSSQIKTVVHGMVLGSLLSLCFPISSLAGTNKKGLSKAGSTQERLAGGVSDGGGNAVGLALFDFYENQGSKKIALKELLALEPLTFKILNKLSKDVPALGQSNGLSLGESLKRALQDKAIYLESKEITSSGCLNQSMVSSTDQKVVGCQDDLEVRFYLPWLQKTDAQNRAGLIVHEMILGWARSAFPDLTKEEVERRVRALTRVIFEGEDVAANLPTFFNTRVYTPELLTLIASGKKDFLKNVLVFCANPWTDFDASMKKYTDNDLVFLELESDQWTDVSMSSKHFQELKHLKGSAYAERKALVMPNYEKVCTKMKAIYSPLHESRFDVLPKSCARLIEKAVVRDVDEWAGENLDLKAYAKQEPGFLFGSRYSVGTHFVCPEARGDNALQIELFSYYRYLLLK